MGYPIYGDFSICYFSTDFVRALKVGKNKKALFWQMSSVTKRCKSSFCDATKDSNTLASPLTTPNPPGKAFYFLTSQVSKADLCDEGLRPFKTPKAPQVGYTIAALGADLHHFY
ncbi:hypothetical protein [Campylobacter lanienae]|uniref:hypothetical protein n=1 Tax=Campylobacter lanienae TaxID=75658 RepID=UPI000BB43F8B|nr:hypothetical protein [Campylobacter lanienae]